ncbi:Glycoside hydrolase family 76 protein [Mycena sanguinolenta]|uniref:Glycoside hydrolase family 76 protein n=1 Tax=Mycena sanguinolenta TaxID=230812 RepID=A0A8H6XIJ8_9AGAR|nr:Glycoside hydrolase family 76 protein [Mycena sanguinolenta]
MIPSLPLIFSFLVLSPLLFVAPQEPSPSWSQWNITASRGDRISLAQAAIQEAISQLNPSTAQYADPADNYRLAGHIFSQLAEFDSATNQTQFAQDLQQFFNLSQNTLESLGITNFTGPTYVFLITFIDNGLSYGHAAAIAYTTYNNPVFLQYAVQAWWAARNYTLYPDNIDAGTFPAKNFPLSASCAGISMAGGTFESRDPADPSINVFATGGFLVLSGLLAEATGDADYLQAATQSADFIHAHLFNIENLVLDTISGRANDSCAINSILSSYNSGLLIEGLSVLYSITQNATILDLIGEIATTAISTAAWQGANGIITNNATNTGDIYLPRGLTAAYTRNAATPGLKSYIEAYLGVQYNAVINTARIGTTNIYGPSWTSPSPSGSFDPGSQANAIQALISTINLVNSSSTSSPPSPSQTTTASQSTTTPPVPRKSRSPIGAIVGAVIAAVALIGVCVGLILFIRHRRRRRADRSSHMSSAATRGSVVTFEPFSPHTTSRTTASDPPLPLSPRRKVRNPPRSPTTEISSGSTTTGPTVSQSGTSRRSQLGTEELLALLYRRMDNVEPEAGDRPPPYPT